MLKIKLSLMMLRQDETFDQRKKGVGSWEKGGP